MADQHSDNRLEANNQTVSTDYHTYILGNENRLEAKHSESEYRLVDQHSDNRLEANNQTVSTDWQTNIQTMITDWKLTFKQYSKYRLAD